MGKYLKKFRYNTNLGLVTIDVNRCAAALGTVRVVFRTVKVN